MKALLLGLILLAAPLAQAVTGQGVYYGGRYSPHTRYTAAHRTLAFGTRVRVTNLSNHRSVVVLINDRGPFGHARRIIDVSRAAASRLGMVHQGVAPVRLMVLR